MMSWAKTLIRTIPGAQKTLRSVRFALSSYREPEMSFLKFVVDPSRTAVDVGAHLGGYTHLLIDLGCRVVAFEANPLIFDELVRMYGHKAKVIWGAVSSSVGWTVLRVPEDDGIGTVETQNDLRGVPIKAHQVPAITLDETMNEQIGFLKIDVEGHELEVLRGAQNLIRRDHPVILIEAEERHRKNAVHSVKEFLLPFGYVGFMLNGQRLVSISKFEVTKDQHVPTGALKALNAGHYNGHYINNFVYIA